MALINIPTTGFWSTISSYINDNFATTDKAAFYVRSEDVITVSADDTAASIFTGLAAVGTPNLVVVDAATGSIQNVAGRAIGPMVGSISFQPLKGGGGNAQRIRMWSELSPDGISWTTNLDSLRAVDVPNDGESFKTIVSFVTSIPDTYYLRFRFFSTGGGTLSLTPETELINGETITGPSVVWVLEEE